MKNNIYCYMTADTELAGYVVAENISVARADCERYLSDALVLRPSELSVWEYSEDLYFDNNFPNIIDLNSGKHA